MTVLNAERNKISIEGDKVNVGGKHYSVQEIRGVRVTFDAPPAMWRLYALGVGIFLATGVLTLLTFSITLFSGLSDSSNSPTTGWLPGSIFFLGGGLYLGVMIFTMVKYRILWRVELDTAGESSIVYVGRNRTDAQSYANRLRRLIAKGT